jgi:lipoteichoic acid synthase
VKIHQIKNNFKKLINIISKFVKKTAKEDGLILVLILTTWIKLIYLDRIIFSDNILGVFLIFTLATSILIFAPAFFFKKFKIYLGLTISLIISFIIWANTVYFRFFGSLIKIEALSIANQATDVSDSVVALMRLSDIFYFIDIAIIIFVILYFKYRLAYIKSLKERIVTLLIFSIISVSAIFIIFMIDRDEHLTKFIYKNFDMNQIERRYGALGVHGINSYRYFFLSKTKIDPGDEELVIEWIRENKVGKQGKNEFTGIASGKNIFVMQIESLQSFAIGKNLKVRK